MWEIYSIGDSAYLAAILNAVAMITGTGDFRQLAGVGFLLGRAAGAVPGHPRGRARHPLPEHPGRLAPLRPDVRPHGARGHRGRLLGGGAGGGQRAPGTGRRGLAALQRRLRGRAALRAGLRHPGDDRHRLRRPVADPDERAQGHPVAHCARQCQQPHPRRRHRALLHQLRGRLHPLRGRHRQTLHRRHPARPELGHGPAQRPQRPHHRAAAGGCPSAPAL